VREVTRRERAARLGAMSRRSQLPLAAIALAALLLIAWIVSTRADSASKFTPTQPVANVVEASPSTSSPVDVASPARALAAEALVVPTPPAVAPSIAEAAIAPCLAGVLVLADGTPAPPCRLRFTTWLRDQQTYVTSSNVFVGTDDSGRFATSELCTGSYIAWLDTLGGNLHVNGIIDAPATDLRLVVPGYLMRIRVLDLQHRPVADAAVTAEWLADPIPGRRAPSRARLERTTDALGDAWLHLSDPGAAFVRATRGKLASATDEVNLRDASGLMTHELVLTEDRRVARFQLVVQTCAVPHVPIRDYCVVFDHFDTGIRALRITSEQVPADGVLEELAVGKYRVRLMPRYLGEPAYYPDRYDTPSVEFVATDDGLGRLELCTELQGRIALRVDVPEASAGLEARASLLIDGAMPKRPMWFRIADEGGVTTGESLPVGVERLSEDVVAPGSYVLRVSAPGCFDRDVQVVVRAGEATHVAVELAR
jgi:hypothetical protein